MRVKLKRVSLMLVWIICLATSMPALAGETNATFQTEATDMANYRQVQALSLGAVLGFGVGHVFQDRYREKGWLFTLVEGGFLLTPIKGIVLLAFLGVKAYEVVDLSRNFQEYKKTLPTPSEAAESAN